MDLYEKLLAGEEKLSLVGLGYVGMPIAVAYAKKIKVVGYDFNAEKVELYKQLQQIMADEAASAYIEDPADFVAIDSNLEGYVFYPMQAYDMEYLHFIK